ncbi:family 78 glycoside hydrolase catalytic domain [Vibrio salinus]|uniref:family 78 glycoside hydrolase catalytic domain n=1 Tax=Vibrio salinus TaxID=2899784 RepID=UPI001E332F28|nr:family 78 glycoside hydrolase catalytic domain [Vibrio salinus]MCE0495807.1 family 78 glycoside hydrolase catalytic domain [Vibrio salinus]
MINTTANWISAENIQNDQLESGSFEIGSPAIIFKKKWSENKKIKKATLQLTSLGIYVVDLNEKRVSNSKLSPGWSDYNSRIYYQNYDITHLLAKNNCLVVCVGDGWYFGNVAHIGRGRYGDEKKSIIGVVSIEYDNGTIKKIVTDNSWEVFQSNIIYSDIIMGEKHDHTITPISLGYAKKQNYKKNLIPQDDDLIRERLIIEPGKTIKYNSNSEIYDFEQNMVGWVKYEIQGNKGDNVSFQYAEAMANNDIYNQNLRKAKQKDTVILNGKKNEFFETEFTYHGFRYVKVTHPESVKILSVKAVVAHSGNGISSKFNCSHSLLNRLFMNIQWSQRGNFVSIPTDCPQRNERMGWLGDAQIFCKTALYNMDCKAFFEKYLNDIRDCQRDDGAIPDVAPFINAMSIDGFGGDEYLGLKYGTGGWADAVIIISYQLYNHTGDKKILIDNYEVMSKLIDYYIDTSDSFIRPNEGYGDWLSVGETSNRSYIATVYFYYSTYLLSYISQVIGKYDEQERFSILEKKIKSRIQEHFFTDDFICKMTQTESLLALKFNLLPEKRDYLSNILINNIKRNKYKLSTGFIGVSYLLPVLSDIGFSDIAYKILLNESNPSWLYSVLQGATTIWERWDSYTHSGGINTESMNSFNHYSLGSVGQWLIEYMAGININHGKGKESFIKPIIDKTKSIEFCEASIIAKDGLYHIRWDWIDESSIKVIIKTPVLTKVILPDSTETTVEGKSQFVIKI